MASELLRLLRFGTLAEVETYVQAHPESLREKDAETGRTVLHDAVTNYKRDNVEEPQSVPLYKIQCLVEAYPYGIYEKDNKGWTPLHVLSTIHIWRRGVGRTAAPHVFDYILKIGPSALEVKDSDGHCPLYLAIIFRCFRKAHCMLEQADGERIESWSHSAEPPLLHLAVQNRAPEYFVRAFIRKIPTSIRTPDREGLLPMHHAVSCRYGMFVSDADVVTTLIQQYPKALHTQDQNGNLPIHIAALNGACNCILDLLHEEYPQGLNTCNNEGCSPLALACRKNDTCQSLDTIEWLIEKNPLAVRSSDNLCYLPLHWAVTSVMVHSVPNLRLLAEKFPTGLLMPNCRGNLPLHEATMNKLPASTDSIKFLLGMCPGAATVANHNGELPMHIACANENVSVPVLDLLVTYNPESLWAFDKYGFLPFHYCCIYCKDRTNIASLIPKLKSAALPATWNGTFALFLACEKDAKLDVIMCLVQHSLELFSGSSIQAGNSSNVPE